MSPTRAAPRRGGVSIGIDVGGTFTDLVAIGGDGGITVRKVPTTAGDQSEGVDTALRALGVAAADVTRIVHGTTVATNMLLERKGARVALCLTAGATDLLFLRRQERASLYDLTVHHPRALVPAELVLPVRERIEPEGITIPLSESEAAAVADRVAALGVTVVAVCLLHSYESAAHERLLRDVIHRRLPKVDVVLSSDVHPEIREYERASTTVAEAYLRAGVGHYLERLGKRVATLGLPRPGVMLSSGGMRPASSAARSAAALALSGPAGGVTGVAAITKSAGIARALSIDIGGTSADVGLVTDGTPFVEPGGSVAGVPISLPRVLVETVSAGGGSIGWIDAAGVLRVGPGSAGMTPGPAAFGRGGWEPTVTDAHVVLGNIRAGRLSGEVAIDNSAARAAVGTLASRLRTTVQRVAQAMIAIADAEMARALRRLSVDRGIDPRSAVLVAFGGGGPLHACGLADRMAMTRVLIPPHAGVLSALGLAMTGEQHSAMSSVMQPASGLRATDVDRLTAALERAVKNDGAAKASRMRWLARSRYIGQGHELEVPVTPKQPGKRIATDFATLHEKRYGFTLDRDVEIVSMRCVAESPGWPVTFGAPSGAAKSRRAKKSAKAVKGRAVIPLPDATMLVAKGWTARPHSSGGWWMERRA